VETLKIIIHGKVILYCLKSKKLVIAKIFEYILTRDLSNSKTFKKETKSLKPGRNVVNIGLWCYNFGLIQQSF